MKVDIGKPEGNYRYQICDLAFQAMLESKITVEERQLYEDWFWELAK